MNVRERAYHYVPYAPHINEGARPVRARLSRSGIAVIELVSIPGAGKTTLLDRTVAQLGSELGILVVDLANERPARDLDSPHPLAAVLDSFELGNIRVLFLERRFDGKGATVATIDGAIRVVVQSVLDGDKQALMQPDVFRSADYVVLNKLDLLPGAGFDLDTAIRSARQLNPGVGFFFTSGHHGTGLHEWFVKVRDWARRAASHSIHRQRTAT